MTFGCLVRCHVHVALALEAADYVTIDDSLRQSNEVMPLKFRSTSDNAGHLFWKQHLVSRQANEWLAGHSRSACLLKLFGSVLR